MNTWTLVRLALIALTAIAPLFAPAESQGMPFMTWRLLIVIFLACPLMLLFVVGIQVVNPYSAPVWRRPSWSVNPFSTREPLQFFHFAGFVFVAMGIGAVARLLISGAGSYAEALLPVAMGLGVLAGVALCTIVFRSKMTSGAP